MEKLSAKVVEFLSAHKNIEVPSWALETFGTSNDTLQFDKGKFRVSLTIDKGKIKLYTAPQGYLDQSEYFDNVVFQLEMMNLAMQLQLVLG